ncbi:FBD-associated F-box protein [Spatholobus suberectus]|nr:FBD-associated F-box protein [Spatholobus suberectus]
MPKLVRADIFNVFGFQIPPKVVCNAEYLRFFFLELNNQECFPVFHNLIHLELNFESYIKWHLVFEMLEHCPRLQTFALHRPLELSPPEIWACPQFVPECISSHLSKCSIVCLGGLISTFLQDKRVNDAMGSSDFAFVFEYHHAPSPESRNGVVGQDQRLTRRRPVLHSLLSPQSRRHRHKPPLQAVVAAVAVRPGPLPRRQSLSPRR